MKQNLAKLVTKESVLQALKKFETENPYLEPSKKYDLEYNGGYYPPKEVVREAARIQGIEIDDELHTLGGGDKTNIPLRGLGFNIVGKNELPKINLRKLLPQIKKYNDAINNTDWLKVREIYKFNFIKWVEKNIDFVNDSKESIKQKIELSQEQKFDVGSNTKGINFLTTIKRFNDDYLTIDDIALLKKISNNELDFEEKTGSFSFNSYPKASLFLSLFYPEKFCPYDGESLPSYEYLKIDDTIAPKKGFKAFYFYQIFYFNTREALKQNHIDTDFFKQIFETNELTDLHWNWIAQDFLLYISRNIMNTNTIQKKYNFFIENESPETWDWYLNIKKYTEAIIHLKDKLNKRQIQNYSELNKEFKLYVENENEDFLNRYLFMSNNGFSTIRQQLIKNHERKIILDKVNTDFRLLENILLNGNKEQCFNLTHELIGGNYWSVIYRFVRALFPNDFTAVDAPNHFSGLIQKLYDDFEINLSETNQIGRSKEILNLIKYDDVYKAQIFFWMYKEENQNNENEENQMANLNFPLNQILYGAPGTGKTYTTKKLAIEIIDGKEYLDSTEEDRDIILTRYNELALANQIHFTTFHQSMSYEDFIEGIKPDTIDNRVTYEVKDGVFKQISDFAISKNESNFDESYSNLLKEILANDNDFLELKTATQKSFYIKVNSKNSLNLYTSENKNKQGSITKEKLNKQVNGHQEFDGWEGYVNGVIEYLKSKHNLKISGNSTDKKYVLIIDEINRGNVSSIFGELITLLEEDKRKGNKEEIEVVLPYSQDKFSVPNNLYIIGTMNTADRSVESLDTALRRRFSFVEMPSKPEKLVDVTLEDAEEIDLEQLLYKINQRIELLIDKDHQIGHSFFINLKDLNGLRTAFKNKIIPLLEEYFFGDFGKIGLVLGENFISVKNENNNSGILAKFSAYEEVDFITEKKVYQIKNCNELKAQDFISIYE
ncbi:hypothetical protein B0A56_03850 [Flavobacterium columnare NBRC 100251 = ATCC 23463]|nr:hypothetical protein B0A56_03850 [Flavobacterium columnare NBRC 100251 = ATCC 23463]